MLLSMTGFGKAVTQVADKKISVEIKSLNSKQLDLNSRVPSMYRDKELELRAMAGAKIERGKVDLCISVESVGAQSGSLFNVEALKGYKKQVEETSAAIGIPCPDDWYSVLLRFPDVMHSDGDVEVNEEEVKALFEVTDKAVDALMNHRRAEGLKLEEFFTLRLDRILDLLSQVETFECRRVDKIRQRIEDGLRKIPAIEIDKGRLEQEMIFYIEKLDVNEEKQRLRQHISYFKETIGAKQGQGKKLGFISQEMGREINTLGSKSNDADMQRIVVMMKDELEQIKEQVLNVM